MDPRRKFIWEEMYYLERWWKDAAETKKESFINLVKNAQLEIVGGGWVMNDENLNFPFGYSSTMAYLLRRMGFENMLIQRTHYELKKELAFSKNLEYIWRQSWDSEGGIQEINLSGGGDTGKTNKCILSDVLKCLGDNKKRMRESTLTTLDAWLATVHLDKMVGCLTSLLL
ncbi:unnamed protein product [Camellia sinensis]